jgi:hypothetical protein
MIRFGPALPIRHGSCRNNMLVAWKCRAYIKHIATAWRLGQYRFQALQNCMRNHASHTSHTSHTSVRIPTIARKVMTESGLIKKSATELRRLIGSKQISPVELLEACIARIGEVNPHVNAVTAT